jgi:hypothetical protein
MKNQVQLVLLLLFTFTFLVYVFTFTFVDAAKLESGVEIIAPTTTETEKICDDTIDNDNDGKIDGDDQDCAGPKRPPAEIAESAAREMTKTVLLHPQIQPQGHADCK